LNEGPSILPLLICRVDHQQHICGRSSIIRVLFRRIHQAESGRIHQGTVMYKGLSISPADRLGLIEGEGSALPSVIGTNVTGDTVDISKLVFWKSSDDSVDSIANINDQSYTTQKRSRITPAPSLKYGLLYILHLDAILYYSMYTGLGNSMTGFENLNRVGMLFISMVFLLLRRLT
jgi:hypothetical protein